MQVELRRGLPRVPGGEPWPPAGTVDVADAPVDAAPVETAQAPVSADTVEVPLRRGLPRVEGGEPWPPAGTVRVAVPAASAAAAAEAADVADVAEPAHTVEVPLRQGLPRVEGGEPWPPAGTVRVAAPEPEAEPEPQPETAAPAATVVDDAVAKTAPAPKPKPAPQPAPAPATAGEPEGVARQWLPWAIGALLLLAAAVFGARWYVGTEAGADFIARYNGIQPLPDNAPTGLPGWLNWAHFFNMFLMALIVKTGWSVRTETKPPAYWAPKNNPKAKISLTLWMHLVLDVAWIALGALFYILLFTTGQWMRIVPTSWEVIPNAVSAGIQYLSLEWPTEDPWVHYNALQELMYFAVVFLAAPLAIISGLRMSPWWPKNQKWFPMSAARAIHFPVMVFFIVFTIIHVALVALTGLRLNLNAMFASSNDASSWTGALVFLGALAAIAAAWFAAKPVLVAPVAGKFGTVSQR